MVLEWDVSCVWYLSHCEYSMCIKHSESAFH